MKKRKGWIVILGIFLLVFCYESKDISKDLYNEYNEIKWEEETKIEYNKLTDKEKSDYGSLENFIEEKKADTIYFAIVAGVSITFVLTCFKYFGLWLVLIGFYLGMKKYYKSKLSKVDFSKNKEYYREILKQYSIDLLGYIDNMEFKYPDVLVSMLLQLKLKGIISIENSNIYVDNNVDLNVLSNSEKYLISKINNNKLVIGNTFFYKEIIIKEGLNKGLLEEREYTKEHLKKELFKEGIIYALVFIGYTLFINYFPSIYVGNNYFLIFIMIAMVFCPFIFIIGYPIYIFSKYGPYYIKSSGNPYFRSKKAEEINKKLEGLKSFLNDFSKLDEREAKEIMLWDEYLIYSVLFAHNKQIIDEYKDLIVID